MGAAKYVRLREGITSLADVGGSGWSITGNNVKEYPEGEAAEAFVKSKLRANILEWAGKAEFDEVHADEEEAPVGNIKVVTAVTHQEASVRLDAQKRAEKLAAVRAGSTANEEEGGGLSSKTKDELLALAAANEVSVNPKAKKEEIVAALEEAGVSEEE